MKFCLITNPFRLSISTGYDDDDENGSCVCVYIQDVKVKLTK